MFGAVVIFIGGRLDRKDRQRLLIILWATFTVIELGKYVNFALHPEQFNIKTGLPFHLCSISLFTYPLAVFTKNQIFRNFIYAVNMPGALFALVCRFWLRRVPFPRAWWRGRTANSVEGTPSRADGILLYS